MKVEIVNRKATNIPVTEMEVGQVGVITHWAETPQYVGLIVTRISPELLCALASDVYWSNLQTQSIRGRTDLRVDILPSGTILKLV